MSMKWLVLMGLAVFQVAGSASVAQAAYQLDVQTVLKDALVRFEQSASKDPMTQQRILTCLGQETLESGVLGEYSQFDPNQWQSINVSGLDLRALTSTVNQTMEKCQRDADRPLLK